MEIFKQRNLIDDFTDEEVSLFRRCAVKKTLPRAKMIFEQGDAASGIVWIESGWVKTYYTSLSGSVITVGLWSNGDVIGAPDIDFDNRLLSAQVVKEASLLFLSFRDIDYCLSNIPRFGYNLIAALSFKVRWSTSIFDRMATESVLARVAQTVVSLAYLYGVTRQDGTVAIEQLSHQDMADMIGASRPTVSLTLRKLERSGFIELSTKKIVVLDFDGLLDRRYE